MLEPERRDLDGGIGFVLHRPEVDQDWKWGWRCISPFGALEGWAPSEDKAWKLCQSHITSSRAVFNPSEKKVG